MKMGFEHICVVAVFLFSTAHAQECLCISANGVNIRDAPCGTIIGNENAGPCFEDLGGSETCTLSGVSYNYRQFSYSGGSGWAAEDYLAEGNCPEPGVPGVCGNVEIVTRDQWGARAPTSRTSLDTPVSTLYIHHTVTAQCYTQVDCSAAMRDIQDYHMDALGWSDIGYNYLIGDDGRAYEGRGWEWVGAHTCCGNCNRAADAISLIGNFHPEEGGVNPSDVMMQNVRDLADCAVQDNIVLDWDQLNFLGHIDACATACPGSAAYSYIQTWAEYGRIDDPCYC